MKKINITLLVTLLLSCMVLTGFWIKYELPIHRAWNDSVKSTIAHGDVVIYVEHFQDGDTWKGRFVSVIAKRNNIEVNFQKGDLVPYVNDEVVTGRDLCEGGIIVLYGEELKFSQSVGVVDGKVALNEAYSVDDFGELIKAGWNSK